MPSRYGRPSTKWGFATSDTLFTSPDASRETLTTLKGPAPTGFVSSAENGNSSLETFCQRREGSMPSVVSPRNGAYGFMSVKRTVCWSIAETPTPDQLAYSGLLSPGSCAFCTVKMTSSAVTGVPLENFASLRKVNVYDFPSADTV